MKKNKNEKNLLFIFIMLTLVFFSFFNAKSIYGLEKICNNKTSCLILPTYERNETIVADFILEPDTDLTKDRSDDIQLALNKCMNEKKGGTVFLEEGIYVVKKPIIIPKLCTLKGDWQDPDSVNNIDNLKYGTIIVVDIDDENYIDFYKSQITSSIPLIHENDINVSNLSDIVEEVGLFTLEDNSGVDGLTIFYKNQNALNPSIQPWTFLYSEEFDLSNRNLLKTIKNITLINSYNGIGNSFSNSFLGTEDYPIFEKRRPHEMLMIENVKGTVLNKGVVVHNSSDVGTITGLELSPKYWANANISSLNALTKPSIDEINNYTKARGWGLTITDVEQQQYYNIKISGYKYGLYIPNINTRIMGSGSFFDIEISNCQVGIIIDKGTHKGNWMLGIIEQPLEGFDLPMLDFSTGYLISNSSIQGDDYAILHLGNEVDGSLFNINNSKYNKIRGRLKLHDVSINGKVNDGRSGEGYTIPGILYYDENNSNYSILENGIYNNNKNGKFRNINLERKTKTTGNVLEVVDSLITADLLNQVLSEVSKKGGGVVYLKAGLYTFNKTIEIPENVELRGVAGVSVRSAGAMPIGEILDNPIENVQGTVIKVARVSDDENQNFATIKLIGDNSGVSGITFIYEENIDILRGNNVNKFDKNHNRIIFSQGTKGIFIKNIALIGAAYGIYLDNCKYFTIANVVSGLLENVIYMNSSSNGVIVNCLQNLSLISRNDIYFVEEQKMIDNGFPITRKTLKYFVIEDSDNIEMLNNFIYGGFVYLESKDSSIYAINNGNDGFGSEDGNHNYVGWQFAFSHDNNKYPNDEKVNNVILINNLRVGGYSIINALGNLGIYNRDFFFKWTQDADPIEKDFLIGTPLMIQPDYKEYNKTKIVSNTNVVYGSNSELVNVYNAEGTIYYSTEKELTSENYMVDGSITVPKAINKDAGEYSCYYYIPEDDKHLEKKGMVKILISKKPLVLTAGSSSRAWNNEALTNRECIANSGGLVSGHIITCSMTSESTITTAGSVNNEISTVTIKSGTTDVTGNYIITKVTGKLTVTVATPKVSLTSKTATYTLTVNKANISPSVSMSGWTYGGTASNPSVSGNSGNGSVSYEYYTNSGCTTKTTTANGASATGGKPSYAGTYWVKATIAATTNYNSGTATKSFTISKKACKNRVRSHFNLEHDSSRRRNKERTVDALASIGDEGRGKLRKAAGIGKHELIRGCPNGGTHQVEDLVLLGELTRGTETS